MPQSSSLLHKSLVNYGSNPKQQSLYHSTFSTFQGFITPPSRSWRRLGDIGNGQNDLQSCDLGIIERTETGIIVIDIFIISTIHFHHFINKVVSMISLRDPYLKTLF